MGFIFAVHVPIAGLALILGLLIIFSPIHIAFLEMVIDPVCTLVFEVENEEEDLMRRPAPTTSETIVLVAAHHLELSCRACWRWRLGQAKLPRGSGR